MVAAPLSSVRSRVRTEIQKEATGRHRHIVVLAVDGIPASFVADTWRGATILPLRSVFPSTSSTAWLTSVSGLEPDDHGIPGVAFVCPQRGTVDVFRHHGPPWCPGLTTIFDDARELGYTPLALLGDLTDLDCAWRDAVLHGSERIASSMFYAGADAPPDPATVGMRLRAEVRAAFARAGGATCLVWCLIDVDRHIHRHGYDDHVVAVLAELARVAQSLTNDAVVIAYSDHGLVPTRHDTDLQRLIDELAVRYRCTLGGAGRTRWIYAPPGTVARVYDELAANLSPAIEFCSADELFRPGSLARQRVGDLVLIALGDAFLAAPGYVYEHGSRIEAELNVPFAIWRV